MSPRGDHRKERLTFENRVCARVHATAGPRLGPCAGLLPATTREGCSSTRRTTGRCLMGPAGRGWKRVNFNNCASALSFKLRRHVIPAPSPSGNNRPGTEGFYTQKIDASKTPELSFLHTHTRAIRPPPPPHPTRSLGSGEYPRARRRSGTERRPAFNIIIHESAF